MAKNKNNQKPDEKPATEVTSENQVTENVEQTEETTEEAAEETAEESAEEAAEEAAEKEAAEKSDPAVSAQLIEKCEAAIKAKGTSMKMMREVFFAIEKDPLRRVNLVKLKDTPAAREMVKSAAEKFLRECTKK